MPLSDDERRLRILESIVSLPFDGMGELEHRLNLLDRWVATGAMLGTPAADPAATVSEGGNHAPLAANSDEPKPTGPASADHATASRASSFVEPNDFRLTSGHKRLLKHLHRLAIDAADVPNNNELGKACAIGYATVSTYLNQLVRWGHIEIDRRYDGHSQRRQVTLKATGLATAPVPEKPKKQKLRDHGGSQRRFVGRLPVPAAPLPADHPAVRDGRTVFLSRVTEAKDAPRLLVDGRNSSKVGGRIEKGPWRGLPVYTLTLEERKTCPDSCHMWESCYGNGMHWPRRLQPGPDLEERLARELAVLQNLHPDGFVVRPHILGDFYSHEYAHLWVSWMTRYPALHIFGYTAHRIDTPIGRTIAKANEIWPARMRILFSVAARAEFHPGQATTIMRPEDAAGATICPAQLDERRSCSTCGLCWNPNATKTKRIAFLQHGNPRAGRPRLDLPDVVSPPAPPDPVGPAVAALYPQSAASDDGRATDPEPVAKEAQPAGKVASSPPPAARPKPNRTGWNSFTGSGKVDKSAQRLARLADMAAQIEAAVSAGKVTRVEPAKPDSKAAGVPAFPSRSTY